MNWQEIQRIRKAQIERFQRESKEIFEHRNQSYGDAIRVGGYLGAVVTLMGDAARLHNLSFNPLPSQIKNNERKVRDTLMDIANYAAIASAMLDDDNITGGINAPYPEDPDARLSGHTD